MKSLGVDKLQSKSTCIICGISLWQVMLNLSRAQWKKKVLIRGQPQLFMGRAPARPRNPINRACSLTKTCKGSFSMSLKGA